MNTDKKMNKWLPLLILPLALLLWIPATVCAQEGGMIWQFKGGGGRIPATAVTADGQLVALGSRDNYLRIFDHTGQTVWEFQAENSIMGVDMAGSGSWIAVASEDRYVYLLDGQGQLLWRFKASRTMNNTAVASDGSLVAATSNDRSFYVLDGAGNLLWTVDMGIDVEAVAIYGTGENARVVVGSDDGLISIYSRGGDLLLRSQLDYDVQGVSVMANGARIVAGTSDGRVNMLNGSNGNLLWSYQTKGIVHSVAISDDGSFVLAGSRDGGAYLLDGGGQLLQIIQQDAEVLGVAMSADGGVLILGTADGTGKAIARFAAEASHAQALSRRRVAWGGLFGGLFLLIVLGVWAVRYTNTGYQVWRTRTVGPRGLLHRIWRARLSYLLLLPTLLLLLTFNYYPAFSGLYHAFTRWEPGSRTEWIGLANFRFLLDDRFFLFSFRNTLILVIVTIAKTMTVPLVVAELIFNLRHHAARYWLRTLFIVPLILPLVVEILLWNNIYDPTIGLFNQTLIALGKPEWTRTWYGDPAVALGAIIAIGFPWVNAFALLIFYGGLISISEEVFDSSKVDGANGLSRFWHIDLPMLMGQIKLLLILNFINAVQTFELVYLTTGGGPGAATYTPALELYYMAMRMHKLGAASAIGMILFVIILAGTIINMRYVRSSIEYEA